MSRQQILYKEENVNEAERQKQREVELMKKIMKKIIMLNHREVLVDLLSVKNFFKKNKNTNNKF